MTTKCTLLVDSCCDLPFEAINKPGIRLIEFPYIVGDQTYSDDMFQSLSSHDFFESMRKGAQPSTSQVSIPTYTEAFLWAVEQGQPCVFLSFSSGLSGSYDAACLVKEQLVSQYPDFELHIVDTKLASIAEGFLVHQAIEQWEKGLTAQELEDWVLEARNFVRCCFMLDDLEALRRGGRIPDAIALAGSKLDIKPILGFDLQGKLALKGVARGRKKGMRQMIDTFKANRMDGVKVRVAFVGNADCPKDADKIKDMLLKEEDDFVFIERAIGPVIGSHVGPGMVALVFWGSDRREDLSVADRIARRVKGE